MEQTSIPVSRLFSDPYGSDQLYIFSNLLLSLSVSDGFTFVKRHQAALIQRLKSVEPVLEHLREQNVLCKLISFVV